MQILCKKEPVDEGLQAELAQITADDEIMRRQIHSLEVLNKRFSSAQRKVEDEAANKEEQRKAARLQRDRTVEDLQQQKPASIEICALLSKNISDKIPLEVKYIGFEIEDRFVVGYGLDFAEKYREVPYIACLD